MFARRISSFKLILEYGKDSLAEQAPLLPGGQVRLTKAFATLEFEFNSDEGEAAVLERFTQAKSKIAFDRMEERVVLKLSQQTDGLRQRLSVKLSIACMSPTLRYLQVMRTSAAGSAPEALMTALLKHCDLSGVWKLRGAEGFVNFWCSCCEVRSWRSLAHMNLSSCGLTSLPPALGSLATLRILRLSNNKLTCLPPEVSALTALEVLAADHNLLATVPAELRCCSSLHYLELEDNRLATPVLDLRALSNLVSLQLYGNPLEYLPELSPATALRSLSLANVRIMSDSAYSRWEVEVAPLPYISRSHKLAPLFQLTFRRSSCQHPLLAGALGRISEDRANCELMAREETAIQQLVLMALSEQPVVAEQACRTLGALAGLGPATARRLLGHDVQSTLVTLLRSPRRASKLCGLTLLGSMAAASEAVSAELLSTELLQLLLACIHADDREPRVAALTAIAHLAFCRENKLRIHEAAGLLSILKELAGAPPVDSNATTTTTTTTTTATTTGASPLASRASPTTAAAATASRVHPLTEARQDGLGHSPPLQQQQLRARSERASPGPRQGSEAAPTASAAPGVVRMPSRAVTAGGGGSSQRYSDNGLSVSYGGYGGPGGHVSASSTPGCVSESVGGATAASASGASPYHPSMGGVGQAAATPDALSPPQQQARPLHHSASTPATTSLGAATAAAAATAVAAATAAAAAAAAGHALTPAQAFGGGSATGPLSPTSPTPTDGMAAGGGGAAAAAIPSGLPPQIALAPPRLVPEPVSCQDPVRLLAIKVLAILGENEHVRRALGQPPIAGRGVRVLALDGGGMRGLALVQIMRHIERRTGRPLHQLFDLVVGTSTGAIVAFGLGVFHFSLDQCEAIYTGLGHKVFNQAGASASGATPREELLAAVQTQAAQAAASAASAAAGAAAAAAAAASSTGWRDSLFRVVRGTSTNLRVAVYGFKHDATTFEELLRQMCDVKKLGCMGNQLIDAAALGSPKVAAVATLVSCCPVTPFLFTSYELPPRAASDAAAMRACPSSSRHQIWQAVRASSAAPYYLDDFVCGDDRYQDGAATANNPSILALQQARLLWPGARLDALVSLGCGAAPPVRRERGAHAVLDTGAVLVDAATSPDRADEALSTLLPLVPGVQYFRFQPVHERCAMELDDVNPQHWAALQAAVDEYCTAHSARFDELSELLLSGREDGGGGGSAAGPAQPDGGAQGGGEVEPEEPFEVPPGVTPDGRPLPPVPRVRLGGKCGVVIVEAPSAPPPAHPTSGPAALAGGGSGCGHRPQLHHLNLPLEQLVVEALAQRPHTLRRCDLAATAADAALSASLVEAHMALLEAQQEQQQEQEGLPLAAEEEPPLLPGPMTRTAGSGELLAAPVAEASVAASVVEAENGARRAGGQEPRPVVVPSGGGGGGGGLLSPPRAAPSLQLPRVPGGVRHWNSSRGGVSAGGWALQAGGGGGGGGGPLEVAGEVVAAEVAAAAAAAEAAGVCPTSVPTGVEPMTAPAAAEGPSSVADAAVEAAAAGAGAAASAAAASAGGGGGSSSSGAAAASPSASAAAAAATSLFYDFSSLFVKRGTSARGMSTGGGGSSTPGTGAGAPAATTTPATASPSAGEPAEAAALLAGRTDGASASASSSLPSHSNAGVASDVSLPSLSVPSVMQPTATPSNNLACPDAKRGGPPPASLPRGASAPSGLAAAPPPLVAAGAAVHVPDGYGVSASAAAAAAGTSSHEVQPAVLLAALLQDLQGRCGLLHLGLRAVHDNGDGRGECGLVAGWRQEVVAVVEPGPDADRILSALGYAGSGGSRPSLSSILAATHGSPLESDRCCSYRLLARQEVWHNGAPLVTLLLQVTRPASLLRPSDFAVMAPQLNGLVLTAAAPLPPPIISALLRAGAAAVICPHTPLLPPSPAARIALPPPLHPSPPVVSSGGATLPFLVLPYSAGGATGGQRTRVQQPQQSPQLGPVQSVSLAATVTAADGRVECASVEFGADGMAVARYFEALLGELVEGATVLGAIKVADGKHGALRGRMVFHHL